MRHGVPEDWQLFRERSLGPAGRLKLGLGLFELGQALEAAGAEHRALEDDTGPSARGR